MRLAQVIVPIALLCSLWTASACDLRQIGMVNLPGAPGFGQLAFADGMLLLAHPGAASAGWQVEAADPPADESSATGSSGLDGCAR
jgi:hypothetical protein